MTRSPKMQLRNARIILGNRLDPDIPHGSAWDSKIHGPTGLSFSDLRYKVGAAVVLYHNSLREAARRFQVSTGFVHYWARIFEAVAAMRDAGCRKKTSTAFLSISNRPKTVRRQISDEVRKAIIALRRKNPTAGSGMIREWIREDLGVTVSCTGIDNILRSEGLIAHGRHRNNGYHGRFEREHSLSMVQIDYKTWPSGVKTMWVLDDASRAILGYMVSDIQSTDGVLGLLERTFSFWGCYPEQILSDHGSEFYSVVAGKGASRLDGWCEERGIEHIMGRVRHPQTQGKIERSHATAAVELSRFGSMDTPEEARETVGRWVDFYNNRRPHMAVDRRRPMEVFFEKLPYVRLERFIEGLDPEVVPAERACDAAPDYPQHAPAEAGHAIRAGARF